MLFYNKVAQRNGEGGEDMPNAQLIKERMSEKGIAQKDLAEAMGIAAPTVSQKINGIRPMNLDEARTMAAMLGIESGEFGRYFFASGVA